VIFAEDDQRILSCSTDGSLHEWEDSKVDRNLVSREAQFVMDIALSGNEKLLLSAHIDGSARLWDVVKRRELRIFSSTAGMMASAISTDGQWIAYGGGGWPLGSSPGRVWVCRTHQLDSPRLLYEAPLIVWAAEFQPHTHNLATTDGRQIRLWNMSTGREEMSLEGHAGMVRQLAYSPDGTILVSAAMINENQPRGEAKVWRTDSGECLATFHDGASLYAVAVSPDGGQVAYAGQTARIFVRDIASGKMLHVLEGHPDSIFALEFSPDGRRLASAGKDMLVKLWNVETGACLLTWRYEGWLWTLRFSRDGKSLAVGELQEERHGVVRWVEARPERTLRELAELRSTMTRIETENQKARWSNR
jgi:WD40 repeat protein